MSANTGRISCRNWLLVGTVATTILCQLPPVFAQSIATDRAINLAEITPVNARFHYQQGLNAIATGNLNLAMVSFDRAIAIDDRYLPAYIERGNVKAARQDLSGALADFSQAIAIDPQSATAYYNRGTILSKSGKIAAAIADYTNAISIDPNYAAAYLNRANNLDDLGKRARAIADYNRAIAIDSNYALAYLNRGIAYGRAGELPKAIDDLNQAARLFKASNNLDRYNKTLRIIRVLQPQTRQAMST